MRRHAEAVATGYVEVSSAGTTSTLAMTTLAQRDHNNSTKEITKAFTVKTIADDTAFATPCDSGNWQGLTKREYIATSILQGLMSDIEHLKNANEALDIAGADITSNLICDIAVHLADELIKALNEE